MTKENTAQENPIELLKEVKAYHLGRGIYDFGGLPDYQRNNESFDAWMNLFSRIENCLASSLSEQKWSDTEARENRKKPNEIDILELKNLLRFCDKYEITIQFWPQQTAVYIAKDGVDLTDFGGNFDFAIGKSIEYLDRITGGNDH